MKITKQQLRRIIKENLNEGYNQDRTWTGGSVPKPAPRFEGAPNLDFREMIGPRYINNVLLNPLDLYTPDNYDLEKEPRLGELVPGHKKIYLTPEEWATFEELVAHVMAGIRSVRVKD